MRAVCMYGDWTSGQQQYGPGLRGQRGAMTTADLWSVGMARLIWGSSPGPRTMPSHALTTGEAPLGLVLETGGR